jgi:hypothetical protein
MAYQNVPVVDGYQVVQQLANFAAANGWVVNRNGNENDTLMGEHRSITVSAPGYPGYVSVAGNERTIYMNGHREYNGSLKWYNQPEQFLQYSGNHNSTLEKFTRARIFLRVNPILSVHFFAGLSPTPYLYAAIEMQPGYYRHMAIGHFQKFGTAKGGLFWDVSNAPIAQSEYVSFFEYHRPPLMFNPNNRNDSMENAGGFDCQDSTDVSRFCKFDVNPTVHLTGGHWSKELQSFNRANPILFNTRTALMSPLVWVDSNGYRPFGSPTGFRYVDMTYFEAGDELTIGGDVWKVFPWARRGQGKRITYEFIDGATVFYNRPQDEATEMYGVAYLKD